MWIFGENALKNVAKFGEKRIFINFGWNSFNFFNDSTINSGRKKIHEKLVPFWRQNQRQKPSSRWTNNNWTFLSRHTCVICSTIAATFPYQGNQFWGVILFDPLFLADREFSRRIFWAQKDNKMFGVVRIFTLLWRFIVAGKSQQKSKKELVEDCWPFGFGLCAPNWPKWPRPFAPVPVLCACFLFAFCAYVLC